jgi:hypothetical protein
LEAPGEAMFVVVVVVVMFCLKFVELVPCDTFLIYYN